jgi:hypothetical protein
MTHEHERDTYTYTNQGKPYKLEAGGTSTNETNSKLGGKTVSVVKRMMTHERE